MDNIFIKLSERQQHTWPYTFPYTADAYCRPYCTFFLTGQGRQCTCTDVQSPLVDMSQALWDMGCAFSSHWLCFLPGLPLNNIAEVGSILAPVTVHVYLIRATWHSGTKLVCVVRFLHFLRIYSEFIK